MEPWIVAARRTPIGTAGHALKEVTADRLAAAVLGSLARETVSDREVGEVLLGNCTGPGGNLARVAGLTAGLDERVPAITVDRQCASGLAAIELACRTVGSGSGAVLAGGVESASTAPSRSWPSGERYERAPFAPSDRDVDMGFAADVLAQQHGISRTRQDEYAARSHERAVAAQVSGAYDHELVPVASLQADERPKRGLTLQRLARFPATFREGGTVTAGNSCGISDGAAAVLVRGSTTPLRGLRVLAVASAGVDPTLPGLGIVPAVRRVLDAGGVRQDQVDVWEFNEAFAGQVLACCDQLGVEDSRICRQGGALALGHPWGASGAVLAVRLFAQIVDQGQGRYGVAAIAAGGGQGTAILVEAHP